MKSLIRDINCSHRKNEDTKDSYEITRTICEGDDSDAGYVTVKICDYCKQIIVIIDRGEFRRVVTI